MQRTVRIKSVRSWTTNLVYGHAVVPGKTYDLNIAFSFKPPSLTSLSKDQKVSNGTSKVYTDGLKMRDRADWIIYIKAYNIKLRS